MACGILVPEPGIESVPPAVEAQSLNHWTATEVPYPLILFYLVFFFLVSHFKLFGDSFPWSLLFLHMS